MNILNELFLHYNVRQHFKCHYDNNSGISGGLAMEHLVIQLFSGLASLHKTR